jgi:hypothetical protein
MESRYLRKSQGRLELRSALSALLEKMGRRAREAQRPSLGEEDTRPSAKEFGTQARYLATRGGRVAAPPTRTCLDRSQNFTRPHLGHRTPGSGSFCRRRVRKLFQAPAPRPAWRAYNFRARLAALGSALEAARPTKLCRSNSRRSEAGGGSPTTARGDRLQARRPR